MEENKAKTLTIRKALRISIYIASGFFLLLVAAVILLKIYTKEVISNTIATQTNGKINLVIGKMKFGILDARLDLFNTYLSVKDSTGKTENFKIRFDYLGMQVTSVKKFFFERKLLVDFIVAENPRVEVNSGKHSRKPSSDNHALHLDLGNTYLALRKIVAGLQIKRFGITNGAMIVHNLAPKGTSIEIGGIHFHASELLMNPGANKLTSAREMFDAGRIRFNTGKQDISFPSGNLRLSYSALSIQTDKKIIEIDSLQVVTHQVDTSYSRMKAGFRRLRIHNFDAWALYDSNMLKVDSIICEEPMVNLSMDVTNKALNTSEKSSLSVEQRIAGMVGRLKLKKLGLLRSSFNVTTRKNGINSNFSSSSNDIEVTDIDIDSSRQTPIMIGGLRCSLRNYRLGTPDGLYSIGFDSIILRNRDLSLINFNIEPSSTNLSKARKFITIPELTLTQLSLGDLISEKRLIANEILLKNPNMINNYLPGARATAPKPLKEIIRSISEKVDVRMLRWVNGSYRGQSILDNKHSFHVTGINSEIELNELLDASDVNIMAFAVERAGFDSMKIIRDELRLTLTRGLVLGRSKTITAKSFDLKNPGTGLSLRAEDVLLNNYRVTHDFEEVDIDTIRYSKASLVFGDNTTEGGEKKKADAKRDINLSYFKGGPTSFSMQKNGTEVSTVLNSILITQLRLSPNSKPTFGALQMEGDFLNVKNESIEASIGNFAVDENKPSQLDNVDIQWKKDQNRFSIKGKRIDFQPAVNEWLLNKKISLAYFRLEDADIEGILYKKAVQEKRDNEAGLALDIGSFRLSNSRVKLSSWSEGNKNDITTQSMDLDLTGISKNGQDGFSLKKGRLGSGQLDILLRDSIHIFMTKGRFEIQADDIKKYGKAPTNLSGTLALLEGKRFNVKIKGKKNTPLEITDFDFGGKNLSIDNLDREHVLSRIKQNQELYVEHINLQRNTANAEAKIWGLSARNGGSLISLDSISFLPAIDRDSFNRVQKYQSDYMQFKAGKLTVRNLDLDRLGKDSVYHVQAIVVEHPMFSVYKDKRLPFQHDVVKPLPVDLLRKIGPGLVIDTVLVKDGKVRYEEFNDKTNSLGTVFLDSVQARIRNIRNIDINDKDSLHMRAAAVLQNTARLSVQFNESYMDSLAAFLFQVRVKGFNLPDLNSILVPIANARIRKGRLDTLSLRAIGRENLAHGKMKMLYKDLNVEFLNKEDQNRKTFLTKTITAVLNLVVRRNNLRTTGTVFAIRDKERGFVNYWLKIFFGGAVTNAGIRSNSKQEKKYKNSLKRISVPEIPEVEL